MSVAGNKEEYRSELVTREGGVKLPITRPSTMGRNPSRTVITDVGGKTTVHEGTVTMSIGRSDIGSVTAAWCGFCGGWRRKMA